MADLIEAKVEGVEELVKALAPKRLYADEWAAAMRELEDMAGNELRSRVPVGPTGNLLRSASTGIHKAPIPLWVAVRLRAPHARFVEQGVPPHLIRPKAKKALAFGSKVRRAVRHPGMPAQHVVQKTKQAIEAKLPAVLARLTRKIMQNFGG